MLYKRMDEHYNFDKYTARVKYYLEKYDSVINEDHILEQAVNPENNAISRCNAIKKIDNPDINFFISDF